MDARMSYANEKDLHNGWNAARLIIGYFETGMFDKTEIYEEVDKIVAELKSKRYPENVRGLVKKLYNTTTGGKYPPWVYHDLSDELNKKVKSFIGRIKFTLKIVKGKVYAFPDEDVVNYIFSSLPKEITAGLTPNKEADHITVVNSDVVSKVGLEKTEEFISKYRSFSAEFYDIRSSISYDWPLFSNFVCVTLDINDSDFFIGYPGKYRTNYHLTIATKLR